MTAVILISAAVTILASGSCAGVKMNYSLPTAELQAADYLDRLIEKRQLPGVQYMVLSESGEIFSYAGGDADKSKGLAMDLSVRLPLYSITKLITAASVLVLFDQGIIDIDDPIRRYIPDVPYDVTIRQILCHSSGIPNPIWGKFYIHWLEEHQNLDRDKLLADIMRDNSQLSFDPGTDVLYSNLGYAVLGRLIEVVSGLSYEEFVHQYVIKPLGINEREMGFELLPLETLARPYSSRASWMINAFLKKALPGNELILEKGWLGMRKDFYMDLPAHGGLIASAEGFSVFLIDLLTDGSLIFSDQTKQLFFTEQIDIGPYAAKVAARNIIKEGRYAIGFRIGELDGITFFGHDGGAVGTSVTVRIYPEKGLATMLFTNRIDGTRITDTDINVLDRLFLGENML